MSWTSRRLLAALTRATTPGRCPPSHRRRRRCRRVPRETSGSARTGPPPQLLRCCCRCRWARGFTSAGCRRPRRRRQPSRSGKHRWACRLEAPPQAAGPQAARPRRRYSAIRPGSLRRGQGRCRHAIQTASCRTGRRRCCRTSRRPRERRGHSPGCRQGSPGSCSSWQRQACRLCSRRRSSSRHTCSGRFLMCRIPACGLIICRRTCGWQGRRRRLPRSRGR